MLRKSGDEWRSATQDGEGVFQSTVSRIRDFKGEPHVSSLLVLHALRIARSNNELESSRSCLVFISTPGPRL